MTSFPFCIESTLYTPVINIYEAWADLRAKKNQEGAHWQSPTPTNYAVKIPTLGQFARVSIADMC